MFKAVSHLKVTYNQLLYYGIHIGHTFTNSLVFSAWLVYSYIKNILIINLYKSIYHWKTGFFGLATACKTRGPIWFVNLHKGFSSIVQNASTMCGEMSWTDNWIHGFLSNYATMARVFRKLNKYYCGAYRPKQSWVFNNRNEWLLSRKTWPRALFVSSVYHSYWPVREALYLGSPCFGVVDTNALSDFVTIPFPGNDESLKCITFYNDSIANFILAKKFKNVIRWYNKIRASCRLISFKLWLRNKWFLDKYSILYKLNDVKKPIWNPFFYANSQKYLSKGVDFYFSRNYGLDYVSGYFTITDKTELSGRSFDLLFKYSVHKHAFILYKLLSLAAIRYYWSSKVTRFNLRNVLLPKSGSILFYSKNFLISKFKTNFFMRLLWRGKFANSRFMSGRYNYRFLYSKFGFKFVKYLFSVRYSRYFSMSDNYYTLNFIYLKSISSILAPSYHLANLVYDKLGHRALWRNKPSTLVTGFRRKIITKNSLSWLFSIKYSRSLKLDQQYRSIVIRKLKKSLRKESNIKRKKYLQFKLKNLLNTFYRVRKMLVYNSNDRVLSRRLSKFHRVNKMRIRRFHFRLMKKIQYRKSKFFSFLGFLRKKKSWRLLNRDLINRKSFQSRRYGNKKRWHSLNKIFVKGEPPKICRFGRKRSRPKLKKLKKIYRNYLIFKRLNSNNFIKFLNSDINSLKNAKSNCISSFVPKTLSFYKLFSRKAKSKYFSRGKYSYYTNYNKSKYFNRRRYLDNANNKISKYFNRRRYLDNANNKISSSLKKIKFIEKISPSLLVNLEYYILLLLKYIITDLPLKDNFNSWDYRSLFKTLFFLIRSFIMKQKHLGLSNSSMNLLCWSILESLHYWFLGFLFHEKNINKEVNITNNFGFYSAKFGLSSIYLRKMQLWIFFNYLRLMPLDNYKMSFANISGKRGLFPTKYSFIDLSYVHWHNWWYFLNSSHNNLKFLNYCMLETYPLSLKVFKLFNLIYLYYPLCFSMKSNLLFKTKYYNILLWN